MSDIFTIHDFENEQQWLKGRMNGIGGSDASVTIGRNPYKSNVELYEEKIGKAVPEDISDKPCVIYGNKAEEPIRELFQADHPEYKVDYHEFRILQSKKYPFMQASLDGELTDQDGRNGILEIKTIEEDKNKIKNKNIDTIEYNKIMQLYNTLCPSLPSVRSLSESRKKAIRARMHTYTVDDFKKLFEKAEASDFLKGANDRNWSATFDWLIKDANMAKVLDGNYNKKKKNGFDNYTGRNYDMANLEKRLVEGGINHE